MTLKNFQASLRAFTRRRPFRNFVVELVNGDRFEVDHPETIMLHGTVIMHVHQGSAYRLFDSESVCQLRDVGAD